MQSRISFTLPAAGVFTAVAARIDGTLRLFANVLFAVSLLASWGVLTLIGVIVTQERSTDFYFANYPVPLARLILRLGFDNIYHGAAYLGVIGLILTSLGVCTFRRVIPARMPVLRPVLAEHMPLHAHIFFRGSEATVRARFEGFLRDRRWQVRSRNHHGVEWTYADRHNWARRGVLVAHIGFVILAAGTCMYWARGFSGRLTALVGQTVTISQTGASIRLNAFHDRIDPIMTKGGVVYQPIDYVSTVRVTAKDGTAHDAVLRVNHPLDIDGTLLYQSTFGTGMRMNIARGGRTLHDGGIPAGAMMEGDIFTLPGTDRSVRYTRFVGTIGVSGMPTADPRPNNPGAVFDIFDGDTNIGEVLLPLGKTLDLGGGFSLTPQNLVYYSGFDYRYDPGIPVVALGAFIMLAGFCICLYVVPARLHAEFRSSPEGWSLAVAATTIKGHEMFEEQFSALVADLQRLETAAA